MGVPAAPRWALAGAAAGTLAGWLVYRSARQEQQISELRERVGELAVCTARLREALEEAAHVVASAPALHANGSRARNTASTVSLTGSFQDAVDMGEASGMGPDAEAVVAARSPAEASPEADRLFNASKHQQTIDLLGGADEKEPDDPDRLWRLARALHGLGEASKRAGAAEESVRLMRRGLDLARRAVQLAPNNFAAHKWTGILVSTVSATEGTKAKILSSFAVRDHFSKAVDLNPKDATSRHLLGVWHFEVASIGWATARVAAAVFATPPASTHSEALRHLEAAEAITPGFYKKNQVLIARVHALQGRKAEARRWVSSALALPICNADDEAAHAEAEALVRSLGP